ncbi:hypothetical protein [Streptomyces sp. H27-S2]|uniref:hypothetical protein n=1 Tax=Streptomyces antarcticus TaxID=2996458 RepID=UPI00226DB083|nr:hypothetical protein [Streptomyces sp. H27-S2]MCY0950616.1 hypothetical protein [Streptomyces sp. H27-S2]
MEIDRTMSYARLVAKLERYDAYRNASASGRGNAARAPRSHWQETYAGPFLERRFPPVLFVFAPAPRRAVPTTREAVFHERARRVGSVNYRLTVATTTLPLLTRDRCGRARPTPDAAASRWERGGGAESPRPARVPRNLVTLNL